MLTLQAKVKYRNEPKQVMPKSEDLSRSLEINAMWTFDTEFPTIFNKACTFQYITHVHFYKIIKYVDASLDAPDNAISDNESSSEMLPSQSQIYITFKSAVKHRQLGYGYPRGQTVHLAEATTQDTYSSI